MKLLAGRTILLTRPRSQALPLAERLRAQGAHVEIAPAIKLAPPRSWRILDDALKNIEAFDIILFTSANAVIRFHKRARYFYTRLALRRAMRGRCLYAVGPATARALAKEGGRCIRIPKEHKGEALARRIRNPKGKRILLPRAEVARENLPRILRARGARVTIAPSYRNLPDKTGLRTLRQAVKTGTAHWVTFTSSSTVERFTHAVTLERARAFFKTARAASIGPVTSAALRRAGIEPAAEAVPYTGEGLTRAILKKERPEPASALRSTLIDALNQAGRIARNRFGKVALHYKGRANIITDADLACEKRILGIILKRFPDHDFIAEEGKPRTQGSNYVWIIDPIDGTTNFAHGFPASCVSIAVTYRGETVMGGIYDFSRKELFFAEKGKGATLNGRPISVSRIPRLNESLLLTGFPYDRHKRSRFYLGICRHFLEKGHGIRRSGSAALDLAWTAAGRVEGFWEFHLNPWDIAAGALLVQEAGGRVTDFKGNDFKNPTDHGATVLATNSRVHAEMLRILRNKK